MQLEIFLKKTEAFKIANRLNAVSEAPQDESETNAEDQKTMNKCFDRTLTCNENLFVHEGKWLVQTLVINPKDAAKGQGAEKHYYSIRWMPEIGLPLLILYNFKTGGFQDLNIDGVRGIQIIHQIGADNTETREDYDPLAPVLDNIYDWAQSGMDRTYTFAKAELIKIDHKEKSAKFYYNEFRMPPLVAMYYSKFTTPDINPETTGYVYKKLWDVIEGSTEDSENKGAGFHIFLAQGTGDMEDSDVGKDLGQALPRVTIPIDGPAQTEA